MPTTRYFASQSIASLATALPQMARFLINDHASITGPGWTIVEAQAGGSRQIPSSVSDMDSFTAIFGWRTGTLTAGDWIVLESANANNTNHFQLYMELESTTTLNFLMIPFENFATGAAAVSPPLFPTSSFGGASGTFVVVDGFSSLATYSIVADEGMAAFLNDNNTTSCDWIYVGELDSLMVSGSIGDMRCYTICAEPDLVGHNDASTGADIRWRRLSPIDHKTILSTGYSALYFAFGANVRVHETTAGNDNLLGVYSVLPAGVWFDDGGHEHFAGFLRNVYSADEGLPEGSGTLGPGGSRAFLHRSNQAEPQICFKWDGSTVYGRASTGSLISPPQISGSNFSFFVADPDLNDNTVYQMFTSSLDELTPECEECEEPAAPASLITGSVDRNRLRITYPVFRRRPRRADLISED